MLIRTLFLDAGGVLVFPNWRRVSDALAARGIVVPPEVLAAADPHVKRRIDTNGYIAGSTDAQRSFPYFNLVLEHAGVQQNGQTDVALRELHAYHAQHNLWEVVPADVPAALARFRDLGLTLVVVSNSNGTLPVCFDRLGLTSCFKAVLDSQREGVEKPDPRLFQRAVERSGASPETTVHVGDLYHVDVVGARRASLHAALLDPHGLYAEADCVRVPTLAALADGLARGTLLRG